MSKNTKRVFANKKWIFFPLITLVFVLIAWASGYHYASDVNHSFSPISIRLLDGIPNQPINPSLKNFLVSDIENSDAHKWCKPMGLTYSVIAQNADQARLISGCNDTFNIDAVKVNGAWQLTDITNEYPGFDFPVCSYVQKYHLTPQIEPYCYVDNSVGYKTPAGINPLSDTTPLIIQNNTN